MSQNDTSPMSNPAYKEAFSRILTRIHHEDTLIGNRFIWLLTSQSIFLTMFGIIVNLRAASNSQSTTQLSPNAALVLDLIPPFALIICILNYLSLLAALFAIYSFCRSLNQRFPQHILFSKENILGPTITHLMGQASVFLLPIGFVAIWLVILFDVRWAVIAVIVWLILLSLLWGIYFPYPSRLISPILSKRKQHKTTKLNMPLR